MKRFSEQFKKQSENIRMRTSEHNALRLRLVSYMEYHPLPKGMEKQVLHHAPRKEGILSEPFKVIALNTFYVRSFAGLFAVLLVVGIPFIAEHALPGDVLYPVKIEFNEQLRSTLAISPYAKVQWETETLERRISEARLLASEGKLTTETETQVAQAVKDHADAAQQEIAQLRQSDSDGAAIAEIALSSALDVQSEVLSGNNASKDSQSQDGHSVAALAQVVAQARDSVQAAQSQSGQPSYEKLLARIEQESTHVSELFESVKAEASPDEVNAVGRSLADIQRKVEQAKAIKNGDAPSEASASVLNLQLPIDASTTAASSTENVDATSSSSATSTMAGTENIVGTSTSSTLFATSSASSSADAVVFNDATSSVSTTTPQAAIDLLRSALGDLQKVISYLTHIDVRQNVSLQDLVPVTLTSEERMAEISKLYDDTRDMQSKILNSSYPSDIEAKVTLGQNKIESDLTQVVSAVKKGDLDAALAEVTQAHDIASDLLTFPAILDPQDASSSNAVVGTTTNQEQSNTSSESAE